VEVARKEKGKRNNEIIKKEEVLPLFQGVCKHHRVAYHGDTYNILISTCVCNASQYVQDPLMFFYRQVETFRAVILTARNDAL